ncbi:MAG: hypothetical protein LC733_07285 [Actinobacteria bacterium]|nr:hypothetical protein [Actinomycetota bacterium]
MGGEDVPTFLTVLAGNRAMERRMKGPRGLPQLERVATVRTHTISLLWKRRPPADANVRVVRGDIDDIDEMADLWSRLVPGRQFGTAFDDTGLAEWISDAPGLDPSCYWLARRSDGRLAGFLGLWDQSSFKQLRVTSYSRALGAARVAFNAAAPALRTTRLPGRGGVLHNLNAIHVCVPPDEPGVLRALVVEGYNASRGRGYSFMNVGLDLEDPLTAGLSGLLAQPTDIWFCLGIPEGRIARSLDPLPVHHEIALV